MRKERWKFGAEKETNILLLSHQTSEEEGHKLYKFINFAYSIRNYYCMNLKPNFNQQSVNRVEIAELALPER